MPLERFYFLFFFQLNTHSGIYIYTTILCCIATSVGGAGASLIPSPPFLFLVQVPSCNENDGKGGTIIKNRWPSSTHRLSLDSKTKQQNQKKKMSTYCAWLYRFNQRREKHNGAYIDTHNGLLRTAIKEQFCSLGLVQPSPIYDARFIHIVKMFIRWFYILPSRRLKMARWLAEVDNSRWNG